MVGTNLCIFLGVLGRDPEVRHTQDGTAIANISLAVDRVWRDKQGAKQQACEWVKVVLMGAQAEFAGQYGRKGKQAYVEGRLQTRKWQDKTGQDRYTTEIVAKNFQLLGKKDGADEVPEQYRAPARTQPDDARQSYAGANRYDESDVPF